MEQAKLQEILTQAVKKCQSSGHKLTVKRQQVLAVLLGSKEPLSAYDIADLYKEQFKEAIPVMSVYRMLNVLLEAHLVHRLDTTNQFIACRHIETQLHQHSVQVMPQFLICDECHEVKEIHLSEDLTHQLTTIAGETGFKLTTQHLELHGLCQNCRVQHTH